jgi:hypothetical protein
VASDSLVDIGISLNGANVGNYSNVSSQSFSVLPTPNYNEVIITGSNDNGSSEVVCSLYGTTRLGTNGSYGYFDENSNANLTLLPPDFLVYYNQGVADFEPIISSQIAQLVESIGEGQLASDCEYLGPLISYGLGLIGEGSTNSSGNVTICIPYPTIQAVASACANNTTCSGSIIINNACHNFTNEQLNEF